MLDRSYFEALDAADDLVPFRAEFSLPDGVIYLDGNSLGALPKAAVARAGEIVGREWGQDLIKSWNTADWVNLSRRIGDKIAGLVGAASGEVVACDATGINLYKVLSMALALRPERKKILVEGSNFPTDLYVTQGLVRHLDRGHEIIYAEQEDLLDAITEEVAVVSLIHVHYKTGRLLDMKAITARAHEVGALVIWDLCHSAGALPVDLNGCGADFAVGCGYKYLNGGPGAPGFVFVARRLQGQAAQPLTGWFGHEAPFEFHRDYRPARDISQMLTGTQPIVSLSLLEQGVEILARADMAKIREKSLGMSELFIRLVEERLQGFGFRLATPRAVEARGSQVSLIHEQGYAIVQALIAEKIIGDFRAPDIVRFGFTPLYLRYVDVWDAVAGLRRVMEGKLWDLPDYRAKAAVT